jgi:hypothetical protein
MASHTIPDPIDMNSNAKTWLQLYVDAMTEKDPYKRLALVEELRKMPRHDDSDDMASEPVIRPIKRARVTRRRH